MLADAADTRVLSERESIAIGLADSVFIGRLRSTRESVHLLVESSVTVDHHDVRRAVDRAGLLARVVDGAVLPVTAGEYAPRPVLERAQELGAWVVANGKTLGPEDEVPEL